MTINKLKTNDAINNFFILHKKDILIAKNNSKYLNVTLGDNTGKIDGKMWNVTDDFEEIKEGDVVYIQGKVEKFKDNLQININSIEKKEVSDEILLNLIPATEKNIIKLLKELESFKEAIISNELKKLINKVLFKEDFLKKFIAAPAASKFHHAYRGGLLEHTVSVVKLCDNFYRLYPMLNRDLLIAGAILHDIGKVFEYDNITFNRTDEGKLLGHITIGIELIDNYIKKTKNFPEKLSYLLKHLILSHHGQLEWGSPVEPLTTEALVLHFADNIDSKIQTFIELDKNKPGWQYNKSLRRNVLFEDLSQEVSEKKEVNLTNPKKIKTLFS